MQEIHPADLTIPPTGSVAVRPHGHIEAGSIVPGPDGTRYFYGTAGIYCYFIQASVKPGNYGKLGKIYEQKKSDFASDVTVGAMAGEVVKRTAGTKETIKDFMDIFMGVLACAGGPVAVAITGMNLLVTSGKVYRNYSIYKEGFTALFDEKESIKAHMPVFYNTVLDEFVFGALENYLQGKAKKWITGSIPGPKVAGKIAGVFIGKLGEDRLKLRLKAINTLITEVLIKITKHVNETHETLNYEEQIKPLAQMHVVKILKHIGSPSQHEAENIVREAADKAQIVGPKLRKISKALRVFGTDKFGDY